MSNFLIGWGRFPGPNGARVTVPKGLWNLLRGKVPALAAAGFDGLLLPPASKAQGGDGDGCDGYGVYHWRDLGDFDQQGSIATRYGLSEELRRLIAVSHRHGLEVWGDIVLHQNYGGVGATYNYPGPDGKTLNGRGALDSGCFRRGTGGAGTQPQDPVASPGDDSAFGGDEKVYKNSAKPRYTIDDALDYLNWLILTLDLDGGRIDDAKGLWSAFLAELLTNGAAARLPFIAEYFDGNPSVDLAWDLPAPMQGRCMLEDFNAHFALANACNSYTTWQMTELDLVQADGDLSWVFLDNPDTDQNGGEGTKFNKLLGYARALTCACKGVLIYGKDYFGPEVWPGSYGMQPWIDNLVYINRYFAYGAETVRWQDGSLLVTERDGDGGDIGQSGGLLTCINMDTWNERWEWVETGFGPNVELHELTGRGENIWTNDDGWAPIWTPANAYSNGRSHTCYVRADEVPKAGRSGWMTRQTFFGAADLRIGLATAAPTAIGRIYAMVGTSVIFDSKDAIEAHLETAPGLPASFLRLPNSGWFNIVVRATGAPCAFQLTVLYAGA